MRIIFAGGGTGGHLFPGVALAQRLPAGDAFFLCTERPFDHAQLTAYGFAHSVLAAPRLSSARFPLKMVQAVRSAATAIRVFRPDVVVGLGGYGSAPTLLAAMTYGVPVVLMEQNVIPGRANRMAARFAKRIYAQWEETRPYFDAGSRFRATGSPLRVSLAPMPKGDARRLLGLDPEKPTVGVVGGSQGAESMNKLVLDEVGRLNGAASRVQFLHVAGPAADEIRAAYAKRGVAATVVPFVREMERVYSACDLMISRSGAMAIAELAHFGVPSVFVPFPHAAEDHQTANAKAVSDAGGAWLVEEGGAKKGAIAAVVENLVSGHREVDNRRRRIARFARPGAADDILGDLSRWV